MRRLYGIDLLKIIAMIMVVVLHIMERGGAGGLCTEHSLAFVCGAISVLHGVHLCSRLFCVGDGGRHVPAHIQVLAHFQIVG